MKIRTSIFSVNVLYLNIDSSFCLSKCSVFLIRFALGSIQPQLSLLISSFNLLMALTFLPLF